VTERTRSDLPPPFPLLSTLVALALSAGTAAAAPVVGFIEEFPGTSTASWSGGTPFSNPGTGGYLGAGDGYLELSQSVPSDFGVKAGEALGPEYVGNWTAAGITKVRVWMNDVGADDAFEMHFAIGNGDRFSPTANFWQYNVFLHPPLHAWGMYDVDLTSGANWTQLLGTGTFANALTVVDRILIRHDLAPYLPLPNHPDFIAGDVGIDHLLLTNGLVGVEPPGPVAVHPVELAPPYPNPARGPVTVVVRSPDAGAIQIQVLDAAGRSVRRATLSDAGNGPRTWLWDGLDEGGRRAPAGLYRVRASGASGGMSRPVVRVD
jgi:hypothetical protein